MARLRSDFKNGTITDNPLTNVATTINSAAFANLPTVSGDELTLILDPTGSAGAPETVKVTAHSAAATSVTVARGQEGSSARQHASGTTWRHSSTAADFITVCTSSTRPTTGLYEGRLIYETDTDLLATYTGSAWVYKGPLGTLGYAQITANQGSITTEVDVTGLSVTVDVKASRRIKVTVYAEVTNSTVEQGAHLYIKEGSTQLQVATHKNEDVNTSNVILDPMVILTPSAGSHTYKVTAARIAAFGTVTVRAAATGPAFILVEDIGPA